MGHRTGPVPEVLVPEVLVPPIEAAGGFGALKGTCPCKGSGWVGPFPPVEWPPIEAIGQFGGFEGECPGGFGGWLDTGTCTVWPLITATALLLMTLEGSTGAVAMGCGL
jgi:hypothetical protein